MTVVLYSLHLVMVSRLVSEVKRHVSVGVDEDFA